MKLPAKVTNSIENPEPRTILTRECAQLSLRCPVCGFFCSHVQAVYTLLGGDESRGLYRGSYLVARETLYRRDALAVRVDGECGHRWDFVFQQHEGQTFIRVDVLESEPGNELKLERI